MEQKIPYSAIGAQASIEQIDREERENRAQKAVCTLLQSGSCNDISHSGHCQKYRYDALLSIGAGMVSAAYTSCLPAFISYSSVSKLGAFPLAMSQGVAIVGCGSFHFFFAREGLQKIWKSIEAIVVSRSVFESKVITQETLITLWSVLAASGAIFGVICAQIDPAAQSPSFLPAGLLATSAAMVAIPIEMTKARCILAHIKGLMRARKAPLAARTINLLRVVRSLDAALDFWLSSSSEFRNSIYDSFMLRDLSAIECQAELLCAIVEKAPSAVDMTLPRRLLHWTSQGAAGVINWFCVTGLIFNVSVFQVLAFSSIFLGVNEARRQLWAVMQIPAEEYFSSACNFTLNCLIAMPRSESFTVNPVNSDMATFMVPLMWISIFINILFYAVYMPRNWYMAQPWRTESLGGQVALICQGNPFNFRNNEVFALSPLFFLARTVVASVLALGAGAVYEGLNLMVLPSNEPFWIMIRTAGALYAMTEIFDFSCNLLDSAYRFMLRHAGSPAKKVFLAGVDVLKNLKTVVTNGPNQLQERVLVDLMDCWYDAQEDAEWLDAESSTSVNHSARMDTIGEENDGYYSGDENDRDSVISIPPSKN